MKRFPNGVEGDFFHQKRVPPHPDFVDEVFVQFPSGHSTVFAVVDNAAALAWVINLGCIELHTWALTGRGDRAAGLPPHRPRSDLRRPVAVRARDRRRRARGDGRTRARVVSEDVRRDGAAHPRADQAGAPLPGRAPLREGAGRGGRAANRRPGGCDDDVEGRRPARRVRGLRAERARPDDRERVLRAADGRCARVRAARVGRGAGRRAEAFTLETMRDAARRGRRPDERHVAPAAVARQPRSSSSGSSLPASAAASRSSVPSGRAAGAAPPTCSPSRPCRHASAGTSSRVGSGSPAPCRSAPRRRAPAAPATPRARRVPQRFGSRRARRTRPRRAGARASRCRPARAPRPRTSRRSRCRRRRGTRPSSSVAIFSRSPFFQRTPIDDAVRGLLLLHLDDAVARAREVRNAELLRDDAVQSHRLEPVEPAARVRELARCRGERESLARASTRARRSSSGSLPHRLAVPQEHVERDELRGDLGGQLADARLGRMQPRLHRVEVEGAVACDHDLAVERGVGRKQVAQRRAAPGSTEAAAARSATTAPARRRRSRARPGSRPISARTASRRPREANGRAAPPSAGRERSAPASGLR